MRNNKLTLNFNLIDDYVCIEAKVPEYEKEKAVEYNFGNFGNSDSLFVLSKSLTSYNNNIRNSRVSILNSLESCNNHKGILMT